VASYGYLHNDSCAETWIYVTWGFNKILIERHWKRFSPSERTILVIEMLSFAWTLQAITRGQHTEFPYLSENNVKRGPSNGLHWQETDAAYPPPKGGCNLPVWDKITFCAIWLPDHPWWRLAIGQTDCLSILVLHSSQIRSQKMDISQRNLRGSSGMGNYPSDDIVLFLEVHYGKKRWGQIQKVCQNKSPNGKLISGQNTKKG